MSIVGEAVQEYSGGDSVNYFFRGDDRAQRSIPAGETLGCDQNVGRNVPMFDGEIPSGAAHAGHYFIGNQQDTVPPANFRDLLKISGRRNHRAQRGPADWLEDERSGFALGGFNGFLQLSRVLLTAISAAVRAIVVAAIAIGNSHMRELTHHGEIDFAAPLVAGNRERAQGRAVIALAPAEHLVAADLADLHLVLPRQLECSLDRLRSPTGEVHGAAAKILTRKVE